MKKSDRVERINSQILKIISIIISDFLEDIIYSVVQVYTKKDLSETNIMISVSNKDKEKALKILNFNKKVIRNILAHKLNIKYTPRIFFILYN